jgi:DNA polymerase-1
MYRFGIHVDTNGLKQEIVKLENECESIRKTIQTLTGLPRLNFNSPIDLRTLFVLNLKLPEVKTESGKDSYAKDVIIYYGAISKDPVVKLFQQWNTVNTEIDYLTQYLAWSNNSRIHPIYSLCGTKQTRQSSFNPNGQNILKKVAHLFYPPPGKIWLDVDCVNIELRIWAYSVGSVELVTRFEAGESIHAMITLILYPSLASLSFDDLKKTKQYDQCKAGNFSRIYGAGDKKANATYGVHNACEIIDKHFPEISRFTKTCVRMAQASVETFFEPAIFTKKGYKVDVPQNKLYKAVNAYVQGTAGEIMGLMMIECFKKDYPMFQQVHDSLKFELDESQEHLIPEILATMRSAGETVIPSCHLDHKVIRHVSV